MRLVKTLSEQRRKQIESHALPYLEDGEGIEHWARARHPHRRADGFVYVTPRRLIVTVGPADRHVVTTWGRIKAWGVDHSARGGPVLGFVSGAEEHYLRLPVNTSASAANVRTFLDLFARRARRARGGLEGPMELRPHEGDDVPVHRRSVADQTRRIAITVAGVVLVVGGIVITPLPGPWSLPIILGGLAVLSSEYDWAKDALHWARSKFEATKNRIKRRRATL